jgi:muconolactone delta-isomerase
MNQYMIEVSLPPDFTMEMMLLVPQQRAMVIRMMKKGILLSYSLANDRSKLWMVMVAEDEEQVERYINRFPLAQYMQYDTRVLMFHNSLNEMMSISLN